ncbi:uncharacterized protein C8Q71DRAFT_875534 [Rhodofomes roseus]|uniref:SWIM-type domain-containing protein n=1 Tax=Rhodofomes roseus TaxID=34475 RepID=A0ABQ8K776_9APHY|nr:uncharacterized protein C8Q71DRAFT_875534 [Rhodofomes roseus]KAH9833112.1 hypothetical protein C8Q71DRAFT_875534 [Rhodofomes roseus]
MPPKAPTFRVRFTTASSGPSHDSEHEPCEAPSGGKRSMSARSTAALVPVEKLVLSTEQRAAVKDLYDNNLTGNMNTLSDQLFATDAESQQQAQSLLRKLKLNSDALESIGTCWAQQWSRKTSKSRRVLFQCRCGYDHQETNSKKRKVPFPFTSCLAHSEVTYVHPTSEVLRIRGYLEHNDACEQAGITQRPAIPVHPDVYKTALEQLQEGATWAAVRRKNQELVMAHAYPNFPTESLHNCPYRWVLVRGDNRALYRQFNRSRGINTKTPAQINIDEWLDESSPSFNRTLKDAIFHYKAREDKGERLEVCIATTEMYEAAWTYAHQDQFLLDGTFGICNSRILLFITMAIDKDRKGIPLAFLMFSAPSGNQHTAAGYNTDILAKLLAEWRVAVNSHGSRFGHSGEQFQPLVAITDTDMKERGALLQVWPQLWLLLCKFHVRQSWKNHRDREVGNATAVQHDVQDRLRHLEENLLHTRTIELARELLEEERLVLEQLDDIAAEKGIVHVDYLLGYWTTDNLWKSWSDYGRSVAACLLRTEVEGVLTTTNHLEVFNRVLKRGHIRQHEQNGRRLRPDVMIKLMIEVIIPAIFRQRRMEVEQNVRLREMIAQLPGGTVALGQQSPSQQGMAPKIGIAYLVLDEDRDTRAERLITEGQLSQAVLSEDDARTLHFECWSQRALAVEKTSNKYNIKVTFDGTATCTCHDFLNRGGACKHIRAVMIRLKQYRLLGIASNLPEITLPTSLAEAYALQLRHTESREIQCGGDAVGMPARSPTAQAASAIIDMLDSDETCLESEDESTKDHLPNSDGAPIMKTVTAIRADSADTDIGQLPRDDFNFVCFVLRSFAKAALDEQAVSRTLFELSRMAPKLDQLRELLDGKTIRQTDKAKANIFLASLQQFTATLEQLPISDRETSDGQNDQVPTQQLAATSASAKHVPDTHQESLTEHPKIPSEGRPTKKRPLPPSPERSQKRRDSYGVF